MKSRFCGADGLNSAWRLLDYCCPCKCIRSNRNNLHILAFCSLIVRTTTVMLTFAENVIDLEKLRLGKQVYEKERTTLKEQNDKLNVLNKELTKELEAASRKIAFLGTIETQAKNQQMEYMRMMDENMKLMKIIERIDGEVRFYSIPPLYFRY